MNELDAARMLQPFDNPPFQTFPCSPIGLVEKKTKRELKMINHLSYPEGSSINDNTDPQLAEVKYAGIADTIDMVRGLSQIAFKVKTDVKKAF